MATFRPVNATSRESDLHGRNREEKDSNTITNSNMQASSLAKEESTAPTTIMFATLATQKPLPASTSFPPSAPTTVLKEDPTTVLHRGGSQRSAVSTNVDMDVSEDNDDGDGEQAGSEEDVVNTDGTISKKQKGGAAAAAAPGGKSQRFFCSDYPPCNLSFTRSEHLARHIRKHTGERPFQCHCNRRFSRLDNLRQHAQTVHQNEDIPQDSLAATGTRFHRQVRTERVRPSGNRSRGNTVGSQTGTIRGHHRNSLSTSSIGSITSVYSNSGHGIAERRRPPPLVMANGERARYTQEILGRPESPLGPDRTTSQSSGGFTTPPSTASYSTHHHISPRWSSAMQSPITPHAPRPSPYTDHRPPARRLSVPSVGVGDPLPLPQPNTFGTPPLGPRSIAAVASAAAATPPLPCFSPSTPSSSVIASPSTPNMGSTFSRPELIPIALDEDFRR